VKRYKSIPCMADIEVEPDGEDYLSRTVIEDTDAIDTGLIDKRGTPIYLVSRMDQIGFVRKT